MDAVGPPPTDSGDAGAAAADLDGLGATTGDAPTDSPEDRAPGPVPGIGLGGTTLSAAAATAPTAPATASAASPIARSMRSASWRPGWLPTCTC